MDKDKCLNKIGHAMHWHVPTFKKVKNVNDLLKCDQSVNRYQSFEGLNFALFKFVFIIDFCAFCKISVGFFNTKDSSIKKKYLK